ncbi:MAG: hypothetical protein WCD86_05585 [Ktedonobacteraceae bacterium]
MNIYETVSHKQYPPNQATDQTCDQSDQRAGPNSAGLASGEQAEYEKPNQPDEKSKDRLERFKGEQ